MSMFSLQRAYHYQQYQCYHSNFCSNWPVIQCLQSSMLQTDHRLHFFQAQGLKYLTVLVVVLLGGCRGEGSTITNDTTNLFKTAMCMFCDPDMK